MVGAGWRPLCRLSIILSLGSIQHTGGRSDGLSMMNQRTEGAPGAYKGLHKAGGGSG